MPLRDNEQLINIQRKGKSIGRQAFFNRSSKCFQKMQVIRFFRFQTFPADTPFGCIEAAAALIETVAFTISMRSTHILIEPCDECSVTQQARWRW